MWHQIWPLTFVRHEHMPQKPAKTNNQVIQFVTFLPSCRSLNLQKGSRFHHPQAVAELPRKLPRTGYFSSMPGGSSRFGPVSRAQRLSKIMSSVWLVELPGFPQQKGPGSTPTVDGSEFRRSPVDMVNIP